MKVDLYWNHPGHAGRLHEKSQRFNQFNLSLQRITEAESAACLGPGNLALTLGLFDLFSESGIVGALVCSLEGDPARLREVLFSCRVLVRRVEDLAFRSLLSKLEGMGIEKIDILVREGPKNEPARLWLKRYAEGPWEGLPVADLARKAQALVENPPATLQEKA